MALTQITDGETVNFLKHFNAPNRFVKSSKMANLAQFVEYRQLTLIFISF